MHLKSEPRISPDKPIEGLSARPGRKCGKGPAALLARSDAGPFPAGCSRAAPTLKGLGSMEMKSLFMPFDRDLEGINASNSPLRKRIHQFIDSVKQDTDSEFERLRIPKKRQPIIAHEKHSR
jgi:hypothetical protein